MFLEQLVAKFGRLPAKLRTKVRSRVRKATREEVTAWAIRLLTASTLAEALAPLEEAASGSKPRAPSER